MTGGSGERAAQRSRVYLPACADALALLVAGSPWQVRLGFAVTPALRAADPAADEEELEFEAFLEAVGASLAGLGAAAARRVVVSADVPTGAVRVQAGATEPAAVSLVESVRAEQVVAVHVDDAAGGRVVAAVLAGAPARLLDDVALLWFAAGELDLALAEVTGG